MARLLLLTNALAPSAEVLPALGLLSHTVRVLPAEATALVDSPDCDVVVVDARRELASARSLCRVLRTTGIGTPLWPSSPRAASPASRPSGGSTTSCSTPPGPPRSTRGCVWP